MFTKFTVSSLRTLPKAHQIKFYSGAKDWIIERSTSCDTDKIMCFVERNYLKHDPLVKALLKEPFSSTIKKEFKTLINSGLTLVAKSPCDQQIIGVSVNRENSLSTPARVARLALKAKDDDLKKYFNTLVKIENTAMLNSKLGVDEMCAVGILAIDDKFVGKSLDVELVKKSLDLAAEKYSYAKFLCFTEQHKKVAEALKMTKGWCSSYNNLLCAGGTIPRAIPDAPNNTIYVYYKNLKKDQVNPCA